LFAWVVNKDSAFSFNIYTEYEVYHTDGYYHILALTQIILILALGRGSTDRALMNDRGQYFPIRLELARLVSSLLYGTRAMRPSKTKNYTAYDRFHGNGPYGEIPIKKEPIRTLGFA